MDIFQFTIMGVELYYILWFFFIFSFAGVIIETIFCYSQTGTIECRTGTLYLPLIPVYGIGAVALSLFLKGLINDPALLFLGGIVVGAITEYIGSYVMEKLFHTVFWDYSNEPLNIHGRICLKYSIYWGFLSLILIYVLDKYVLALINWMSRDTGEILLVVITVLAIFSFILTSLAFVRFRKKVAILKAEKNGTTPTEKLSKGLVGKIVDLLAPDAVMVFTFPNMNFVQDYMNIKGIKKKVLHLDFRIVKKSKLRKEEV
ncbi:putative ABC transporter permease [Culicoidibacter larvae]|uniref:putative ABC transporter permease n=1 Tax=Culicoidibacter larvae TaxID=2579976 RepID=UPI0014856E8A|nr:putative ABC transporter permease [Culicoidibacter larvae]